jgi:DNA mismatch repair protein MutL
MGKITILPDTLCNQIAAGEVVERPAAAAKELMENSIDAGSRRISLTLVQGGRKEIRIVDNGCGMSSEDALLAIERHATSKLRTVEDLGRVHTLGFRGEALPSIAAVSRFDLVTREPEAISGTHIRIEGGIIRAVKETGCPPGTLITIRDLFFNVPARRKFLRTVDTELSYVSDQFLRLALAHPEIHFQMTHGERSLNDWPRARSFEARVAQVLGAETATRLRPVFFEGPSITLRGLVSPPELQRAGSQMIFAFVNGRPVRDRTLNHGILSAYESMIPKGRFPTVALFINLAPDLVDVNVHPTKREVRFRQPGEVLEAVRRAIGEGLHRPSPVPLSAEGTPPAASPPRAFSSMRPSTQAWGREEQTELGQPAHAPAPAASTLPPAEAMPVQLSTSSAATATPSSPGEPLTPFDLLDQDPRSRSQEPRFSRCRPIGQLMSTYILVEDGEGLILIDQHAAHERILYNAISSRARPEAGQRLLQSVVFELMPRQAAVLRGWIPQLREMGFEMESFGGDSFVVQAVPVALSRMAPDLVLRDLVEKLPEEEPSPRIDLFTRLAQSAACHDAIKASQKLHLEEMRRLLESLDAACIASTCPHGRPVWVKLTAAEIARMFHRT